ncbi:MAG TPA: hypothetical protein VGJ06_14305 [Candidatus Acidoferrum sp.]|jgi:hypothetical protein
MLENTTKPNNFIFSLILPMLLSGFFVPSAVAQDDEQKGVDQGNYNIKQSIEFGGRITSIGGDTSTYDTFVNLQQGPRLLGFTTEMQSLNHHGSLFDRLYFDNFGYGGDPNNISRLRISKNNWYDFDVLFRRDENTWNYSLLANPLNPTTPFANGPAGYGPPSCTSCVIGNSPHLYNTRRRMSDYTLLLLPESKIRFRAGYSRNVNEGPTLTTIHQGTEQLLFQDEKDTVNAYRVGVDFRVLPRTNISYDQILNYYKGDTGQTDNNQNFLLSTGTPVDLGVSFNAAAKQPCGGTFLPGGVVNPTCSAYINYLRHGRTRTNSPTEQLSLQSNYFKSWEFSAKASYTAGNMNVDNWLETLTGREARTNLYNQTNTGPVFGRHVAANADFGATWRITSKLSFVDSFHFSNWHNPTEFDNSSCSFFTPSLVAAPNVLAAPGSLPLSNTCLPPANGVAGTPTHNASSAPDVSFAVSSLFLKQDEKTNLSELEYQFSSKLGVRGGFRYRHRSIDDNDFETATEIFFPDNANRGDCALSGSALPAGCTPIGGGAFAFVTPDAAASPDETLINEYSGLFGIWARPVNHMKISFDTELTSADNSFTRISPRQTQEYRLRTTYKPADWFNLSGSVTIWEGRNNVFEVNNLQHNRVYAVSAGFQPNEKFGLELGYDFNDVFSQILICFTSSAVVTGPSTVNCTGVPGLVQQLSTYTNNSNFGYFDASWTPTRRLTARAGANLTGTTGTVLIISPNAPSGPLDSTYYQPFGGIDYHFAKGWTGKAYWGYYGYHEDQDNLVQDTFAPRNFRANLVTLSLRYSF